MDADHTRKGVVTSSAMSLVAALMAVLTPASTSVPPAFSQIICCFHTKKKSIHRGLSFKNCFFLSTKN
jgi:hypothetical protein